MPASGTTLTVFRTPPTAAFLLSVLFFKQKADEFLDPITFRIAGTRNPMLLGFPPKHQSPSCQRM
jgi:hypothetical protein